MSKLGATLPVLSIDGLCVISELFKDGLLASMDKVVLDMSREPFVIGLV